MKKPAYGYCPRCDAPGVERERRPDGNDHCANGHTYPSRAALLRRKNPEPRRTPAAPRRDTLMVQLPYPCQKPAVLPPGVEMHLSAEEQGNFAALGIPQALQDRNADLVEVDCTAHPLWTLRVDATRGLALKLGATLMIWWDSAGQYSGTVRFNEQPAADSDSDA